jgi:oligopeptide/dipeptide ABC transporter ATP-binding protein
LSDIKLEIKNLTTTFKTENGTFNAVENINFKLKKGKILGLVGESGCGKSITALSIINLLPKPIAKITNGNIFLDGIDLTKLSKEEMYRVRGKKISMIFQEPMTALNPVHRIGKQIIELFDIHFPKMSEYEKKERAINLLKQMNIPDPEKRMKNYSFELSGGLRQRVMIAMALACQPEILIADEPTTALDVTIQAQILDLLKNLQIENNMSVIFITHDLGVISQMCDEVLVMYAGKIVETASVLELFESPSHPYTKGLLSSIPRLEDKRKTKLNVIKGMVENIYDLPKGCRFQNRCPYTMEICKTEEPEIFKINDNHYASCYLLKGN